VFNATEVQAAIREILSRDGVESETVSRIVAASEVRDINRMIVSGLRV